MTKFVKDSLRAPNGFFVAELVGTARKMADALEKKGYEVIWGVSEDNKAEVILSGIVDPFKIQAILETAGVDSVQVEARFRFIDHPTPTVKISTRVFRYYGAFGHE